MLLDGYWRKDLYETKKQLEKWSKYKYISFKDKDKAEHMINRGLLFSAAIIRKIFEDEKEAKKTEKKLNWQPAPYKILHYTVPVKEYNHTDSEKDFYISNIILSDYDLKNSKIIDLSLKALCDQFIHSYVWGIVYSNKQIYGAIFASDKQKEKSAYLLKIEDWIEAVGFVAENCNINSRV